MGQRQVAGEVPRGCRGPAAGLWRGGGLEHRGLCTGAGPPGGSSGSCGCQDGWGISQDCAGLLSAGLLQLALVTHGAGQPSVVGTVLLSPSLASTHWMPVTPSCDN